MQVGSHLTVVHEDIRDRPMASIGLVLSRRVVPYGTGQRLVSKLCLCVRVSYPIVPMVNWSFRKSQRLGTCKP